MQKFPMDTRIPGPTYKIPPEPPAPATTKQAAQSAVLRLIAGVAGSAQRVNAPSDLASIGKLLEGCAAVLRAMDEITVSNE